MNISIRSPGVVTVVRTEKRKIKHLPHRSFVLAKFWAMPKAFQISLPFKTLAWGTGVSHVGNLGALTFCLAPDSCEPRDCRPGSVKDLPEGALDRFWPPRTMSEREPSTSRSSWPI